MRLNIFNVKKLQKQKGSTAVILLVIVIIIILLSVISYSYWKPTQSVQQVNTDTTYNQQPVANVETQIPPVNTQVNSLVQDDTSFKFISPKTGDVWKIGSTYSVSLQNLPKGSFVQGWLEPKKNVVDGPENFGVLETGRNGNPSSNIQVKVPSQYCGGECGAVVYVTPGQYRLLLRVYPDVSNPSYKTYYSDYFTLINNSSTEVTTNPNMSGEKYPELTVISPNGGEKISYGNIYMAGDLSFTWKLQNENLKPTAKFAAYLIDENNTIIRSDFIKYINPLGNGKFMTSFAGEKNIQINKKYKIRVCDEVNTKIVRCDESDDYFTVVSQ